MVQKIAPEARIGELKITEDRAECVLFLPGGGSTEEEGEKIFDWAVAGGHKILGMSRKRLSLEDIFVKLTTTEGGVRHA